MKIQKLKIPKKTESHDLFLGAISEIMKEKKSVLSSGFFIKTKGETIYGIRYESGGRVSDSLAGVSVMHDGIMKRLTHKDDECEGE